MVTTSYKIQCVELTQKKKNILIEYVNEYSRIYNIVGKLLPSLPEKYIKEANPSKLYAKWVAKDSKQILKSDLLSNTMIQSAMSDAITNYKTSSRINQRNKPNIIKFANSEYKIIELISKNPNRITEKRYGIIFNPLYNNIDKKEFIIPIINGKDSWGVTEHLENGIKMAEFKKIRAKELQKLKKEKPDKPKEKKVKAGLGVITYNLQDNTISIPNEIQSPKISKYVNLKEDNIKTIIGVDLGKNNIAVMVAIDISHMSISLDDLMKNENLAMKTFSLRDVPNCRILKFKYIDGFANNNEMKQLRKSENMRRRIRKDVGNRRSNLTNFTNHHVSHIISEFAVQFPNSLVIFEDNLANMKNPTWSPSDVREKCKYKLAKYGINIFSVFAAYTSKMCHKCGVIGVRNTGDVHFKCPSCGLGVGSNPTNTIGQYNADGNACVNIALRGLYVLTRPKKEREIVEYIDGSVEEPNTHPNENVRENNTTVHNEALDGTKNIRKDEQPDAGETILGISIGKESNPIVSVVNAVSSTSEKSKDNYQISSLYIGVDNFPVRTKSEQKTIISDMRSQSEF